MKRTIFFIIAVLAGISALFIALSTLRTNSNTPAVAASFYPIAFLTEQITGDAVPVFSVTPLDTEPHDYELTPTVMLRLTTAPLFIHTGADLEPWATKIVAARTQNLPSLGILNEHNARKLTEDTDEHEEARPGNEHNEFDPHFWISPAHTLVAVNQITLALTRTFPSQEATFNKNAYALSATLTQLDADYRTELTHCASRILITDHDAFGYLAADYNLEVHAIRGISPDEEPSAETLSTLTELVRTQHIKTIFTEELIAPDIAETIARETGAQVQLLSTIEGLTEDDIKNGNDYFSKLRGNLKVLTSSLGCK